MKNKKIKITEAQLQELIREAVLKEMVLAQLGRSKNWKLCSQSKRGGLDLPDGFVDSATGRAYIKKAEKLATFTAEWYGLPGFFCNIFNSLFGDNPEREYKQAVDKAKSTSKQKELAFDIYSAEFNYLSSKSAKFVPTMAKNYETPTADHIRADRNEYDALMTRIDSETSLMEDPVQVIKTINGILNVPDKGSVRKVKKLRKEASIDNSEISNRIRTTAKQLLKSKTNSNLLNANIYNAYKTYPEFERFVKATS